MIVTRLLERIRWILWGRRRAKKLWKGHLCNTSTVMSDHPLTAEEIRHLAQLGGED